VEGFLFFRAFEVGSGFPLADLGLQGLQIQRKGLKEQRSDPEFREVFPPTYWTDRCSIDTGRHIFRGVLLDGLDSRARERE
jgi:hypothetical protein